MFLFHKSILYISLVWLPWILSVRSQEPQYPFRCDREGDTCPTKNDGFCDEDCVGGDCDDCDICWFYDLNCDLCLSAGCYWCAASGKCSNSNTRAIAGTDCKAPEDYSDETCGPETNPYSDPLYSAQAWVYDMIGLVPVWNEGFTGSGIRLRVNDDGVLDTSSEFEGRFDLDASCANSSPPTRRDNHGTAVASIAAGGADSDCAVGISPGVTISSCYVIKDPTEALQTKIDQQDISLNAYGKDACKPLRELQESQCPFKAGVLDESSPCFVCDFSTILQESSACGEAINAHCIKYFDEDEVACIEYLDLFLVNGECRYNVLPSKQREAIISGITTGRNGKGIVYIWSSGNQRRAGDHTNFQGYLNTRFTISVGAVDRKGYHAPYSVGGSSLFLTAPGGNSDYEVNHVVAGLGTSCNSPQGGFGTSFAAPVVAGVVALMLEANPELSWRDVQGILASTSKFLHDDENDTSLTTNAAGFQHSDLYGFGVVQATDAVAASKTWELYGKEESLVGESGSEILNIPDNSTLEVNSTITLVTEAEDFITESVVVYLEIRHFSRGDLDILLTSPSGTVSVLHPGNRPENSQTEDKWKLMTLKSYGESAVGNWTLTIADASEGDVEACLDFDFSTVWNETEPLDCAVAQDYCDLSGPSQDAPNEVLSAMDNDQTILSACCVCGGGIQASDVDDVLRGWQIAVYGRSIRAPTESPSMAPVVVSESPDEPTSGDYSRFSRQTSVVIAILSLVYCMEF